MSTNKLWYVTFHGGSGKNDWNNIHVFTAKGEKADPSKALDVGSLTQGVKLRELRGMTFGPDGNLYVVNAYKKYSQILCFTGTVGSGSQHEFIETFTQRQSTTNPGLYHPFQASFSPDGNLYVASQDTNVVTRYLGPLGTSPGSPMSLPPALQSGGAYYPGTMVPAASQKASGLTSVRGTVFGPDGNLYVADEDANKIFVYDTSSGDLVKTLLDQSDGLDAPDHLLFDGAELYIGNSGQNTILLIDTADPDAQVSTFIDNQGGEIDKPSGMCFGIGNDGTRFFFLASRKGNRILYYKPDGDTASFKGVLVDGLKDNPEFIMQVSGSQVGSS